VTREEAIVREKVMLKSMLKDKNVTAEQIEIIHTEIAEVDKELEIIHGISRTPGTSKQAFTESLGLRKPDEQQSEPIFLSPTKVKHRKRDLSKVIKSGIDLIDKKIIGFNPGELSIWSGSSGSGKSTVLSQIALDTVDQNFKVAIFSGELNADRVLDWLNLQAAGKRHTEATQYENFYRVPDDIKTKVNNWLEGKLFIYNNNYGNNVSKVLKAVMDCIKENGINMVIIDNMMSLEVASIGGEKYERQTALVIALSEMAKQYHVHIHFVAHPKKSMGFLRKNDISGTSDIANAADNVFIVHRVGTDFKRLTKQDLGFKDDNLLYSYSNVIEICKNRDLGIQDFFIGTFFEKESKRFLNMADESKRYGWEADKQGFMKVDEEKLPFDD
jgi:twinkle protein